MDDTRIIRNMRHMAWERAKGELRSMMHTYWGKGTGDYEKFRKTVKDFIKTIEDEGLHE